MKLITNFRKHEFRRMRHFVAMLYASALLMVLAGSAVLKDYLELSADAASMKARVDDLQTEKQAHVNIYQGLGGNSEAAETVSTEWITLLSKYKGRSPDYLLYAIERAAPQSLYLTGFSYDRLSGSASVNAVTSRDEQISTMLETLERTGDYRKVLLVNKSDMEQQGKTKLVIRLEEMSGRGGDE
jgi:hypothetical protein